MHVLFSDDALSKYTLVGARCQMPIPPGWIERSGGKLEGEHGKMQVAQLA